MTSSNRNKLVTPGSKEAIDRMKYEIANEFGVQLGADATARANGSVGGEITRRLVQNGLNRRLVQMGQSQISGNYNMQNK